jgi:hypothetical protein
MQIALHLVIFRFHNFMSQITEINAQRSADDSPFVIPHINRHIIHLPYGLLNAGRRHRALPGTTPPHGGTGEPLTAPDSACRCLL